VWVSGCQRSAAVLSKVRKKAAEVGADALVATGLTFFAETMGIENEVVSPRAVSYGFPAVRSLASPPSVP
jgi:hypothetical protein